MTGRVDASRVASGWVGDLPGPPLSRLLRLTTCYTLLTWTTPLHSLPLTPHLGHGTSLSSSVSCHFTTLPYILTWTSPSFHLPWMKKLFCLAHPLTSRHDTSLFVLNLRHDDVICYSFLAEASHSLLARISSLCCLPFFAKVNVFHSLLARVAYFFVCFTLHIIRATSAITPRLNLSQLSRALKRLAIFF